jgi:hypothetical protein
MAEVKRKVHARVGVDRDEQHVAAAIKNALRAAAVVVVDIEDGDPFQAVVEQVLGGQRRVVQEAAAAEDNRRPRGGPAGGSARSCLVGPGAARAPH